MATPLESNKMYRLTNLVNEKKYLCADLKAVSNYHKNLKLSSFKVEKLRSLFLSHEDFERNPITTFVDESTINLATEIPVMEHLIRKIEEYYQIHFYIREFEIENWRNLKTEEMTELMRLIECTS